MYLYPHKKSWAKEYAEERALLLGVYGEGLELHHIGSTAIDGLFAKDCIDILGVVENIEQAQKKKAQIVALGYSYKGEYGIPGRAYFSKKHRKVHLHIHEMNDLNARKHLNFVQVMRHNPQLVEQLNILKQELHARHPDNKELYQKEKSHFYDRIHKMPWTRPYAPPWRLSGSRFRVRS